MKAVRFEKSFVLILGVTRSRKLLDDKRAALTLILLTWRIWSAPNNASKWQMGFNSAFKGF